MFQVGRADLVAGQIHEDVRLGNLPTNLTNVFLDAGKGSVRSIDAVDIIVLVKVTNWKPVKKRGADGENDAFHGVEKQTDWCNPGFYTNIFFPRRMSDAAISGRIKILGGGVPIESIFRILVPLMGTRFPASQPQVLSVTTMPQERQ